MATAYTDRVVRIRAKAFTGFGVENLRCIVDADGTVRVYDAVAGYYTLCHSMSKRNQVRVRKLAAR